MNITKNKEFRKLVNNKLNQNNFISSNKSPQPTNKIKIYTQSYNPYSLPNPTKNYGVRDNLDKNININEYLNNKQVNFYQNRNKNKGRSPENLDRIQNNNYFNYKKGYNSNTNYNQNIMKHFENDDIDDKNINIKKNKEVHKYNKNLKKKIMEIKEQNIEEYNQYVNKNVGNNNIYNYNNYFNGNYYNNNFNQNDINNQKRIIPHEIKTNEEKRTKKYDNYDNYRNYNKNKNKNRDINTNINSNKNYHKYSQDYRDLNNKYLGDNNYRKNIKNQTQDNYYKNNYHNNNDSSSSNIYDDSYDYKTQYNFKKNPKKEIWDFAKFYNASSQENSYSEDNNYNTTPFRPPLKNDEEHYHQNLTIKIKNPEEQPKVPVKYVDNTPEGCVVNNNIDKKNKKVNLSINNENIIYRDNINKNRNYYTNKTNIEYPKYNKYENNSELSMKYNKRINNNRSPENYKELKDRIKKDLERKKKIKEITVDLSPKKKLNLSNSNQYLGRRNKVQNISSNINFNQNAKIESCIITFDKNQRNNQKYQLSNSLDRIPPIPIEIKYFKKKVITSNNRKNFHDISNIKETPGFNINENNSPNYISYNKSGSVQKIYQKPGTENKSRSIGKSIDNLEMSGEVKDYCAPSPDYGKRGKEAYLNSQKNKNINNNSPLLSNSGNFQLLESGKKDNASPFKNKKYDEFSFKEKNNDLNNKNDVNYSSGSKAEINLVNNENKNKEKETSLSKLIIKSFSNKKKEIKEKPKLFYTFYRKYYDIYIQIPPKEKVYITKIIFDKKTEKEIDKSYEDIEKKIFNQKLMNAPVRGKMMEFSTKNFYIKNNLNLTRNDGNFSNQNNSLNIELDENIVKTPSKNNNKIIIRTIIKKIKRKQKKDNINKSNNNANKININLLMTEEPKTKTQIQREKKLNSILKEDFENYIIYYKDNIKNNINKKYDWSMIELLMIKIKLDIADMIKGYLKACEDIISENEDILIGNNYISNIIKHYKNNYLTNKNFDDIHKKLLKIFIFIKEINIESDFKYKILWGIFNILINNELIIMNDFDILKQSDEENKKQIRKILDNSDDIKFIEKINF